MHFHLLFPLFQKARRTMFGLGLLSIAALSRHMRTYIFSLSCAECIYLYVAFLPIKDPRQLTATKAIKQLKYDVDNIKNNNSFRLYLWYIPGGFDLGLIMVWVDLSKSSGHINQNSLKSYRFQRLYLDPNFIVVWFFIKPCNSKDKKLF